MGNLFAAIYLYFKERRALLYTLMALCFAVMVLLCTKIRLNEDIMSFIPNSGKNSNSHLVFDNLKSADKIFIMLTDSTGSKPDSLIEVAENFTQKLEESQGQLIESIILGYDDSDISSFTGFIYENLPLYLTDEDYDYLDKMLTKESVERRMEANYKNIIAPQGIILKKLILEDPLGIGNRFFLALKDLGNGISYSTYDGYIFSEDMSTLLIMVTPRHKMSETGANTPLVKEIEELAEEFSADYFGGATIAVYNAENIKGDTYLTITIAMVILTLIITIAFRNKFAILLIGLPVLFGGLFGLSAIVLIKGSISSIAIGTGTAIFGIAMSYAIHIIAHQNHTDSVEEIIRELAYPLTIGSITTIGAFMGLLLTESSLLQDFGLFASLSLIGTTLFCLIFLPHLLGEQKGDNSPLLQLTERITGYEFHKKRWLTSTLAILTIISLFWYNRVEFNSNMNDLSIMPQHIMRAEERLQSLFNSKQSTIFISTHQDADSAAIINRRVDDKLAILKQKSLIDGYTSLSGLFIPKSEQLARIGRWNSFWEEHDPESVMELINEAGMKAGFKSGSFRRFAVLLEKKYGTIDPIPDEIAGIPFVKEQISRFSKEGEQEGVMIISKVEIPQENKPSVYREFEEEENIVVADKSFYSSTMAESIKNNFNTALAISSILIFIALLLSYGRIELALLAFLPMAVAWLLILAIMAIFKIEFNIINIILSTFIFGIGDDFSIFIMDGLIREYKTGEKSLPAHKTAIFFSAISVIIGIGALIFATHPALKSIALVSIIGMGSVVLVSFTVQPVIFNLLIKRPAENGGFPYTALGILNTLFCFLYFLLGCIVIQAILLVLLLIPYNRDKKKALFHHIVNRFCRIFLKTMFTVKHININPYGERFEKPAVIIANHQSFIDILVILALCPKCIMVTNSWVWHSPFFGWIIRYADFYHTGEGYGKLVEKIRPVIEKGYSVVIFPEGTRSATQIIQRFKKGAMTLAQMMNLDILPIALYGNGNISSKSQPFYIKKGIIASSILERIAPHSNTDRLLAKECRKIIRSEFERISLQMASPDNSHFRNSIIKNYTYKGAFLELYMRRKMRSEGDYITLNSLIPHKCSVVVVGCGYGEVPFILSLHSSERSVIGVESSMEKVITANNSLLARDPFGNKKNNIEFICTEMAGCSFQTSKITGSNTHSEERGSSSIHSADIYILDDGVYSLPEQIRNDITLKCTALAHNRGGSVIGKSPDGDWEYIVQQ